MCSAVIAHVPHDTSRTRQALCSAVIAHVPSFRDVLKLPPPSAASAAGSSADAQAGERRMTLARRLCGALKDLDMGCPPPI